jgi:esterase/lipase
MKTTQLEIINKKGLKLQAYLEVPANQKPSHFAIFAHCFSCNSNFKAVKNINRSLTNHGFGVVRFDFTGLGNSEGEFAESHFSANVADLIDVNNYLEKHYKAPSLLIGHSLSGAAAIVAASKLENIKAVSTIGAPASVENVTLLFSHASDAVATKGNVEVYIGGRPFKINQNFIIDYNKTDLLKTIKKLRKPLLVMHSPIDKIVGMKNGHKIYYKAQQPKSFTSLDNADHLITTTDDSIDISNMIGSWVQRYFKTEENSLIAAECEQLVAHLNVLEDNFTTSIET